MGLAAFVQTPLRCFLITLAKRLSQVTVFTLSSASRFEEVFVVIFSKMSHHRYLASP